MVSVRVLFFAQARDAAGRGTESLSLPGYPTAGDVLAHIVGQHPGLIPLKDSIRISVNKEIAGPDALIHDGDELAVLPPVAGG